VGNDDELDLRGVETRLLHTRHEDVARLFRAVHRVDQMIPALVVIAQAFCEVIPMKYRLSKTLVGSMTVFGRVGDPPPALRAPGATDRSAVQNIVCLRNEIRSRELHRDGDVPLRFGRLRPLFLGRNGRIGGFAAASTPSAASLSLRWSCITDGQAHGNESFRPHMASTSDLLAEVLRCGVFG
jgi:hypothetical protein